MPPASNGGGGVRRWSKFWSWPTFWTLSETTLKITCYSEFHSDVLDLGISSLLKLAFWDSKTSPSRTLVEYVPVTHYNWAFPVMIMTIYVDSVCVWKLFRVCWRFWQIFPTHWLHSPTCITWMYNFSTCSFTISLISSRSNMRTRRRRSTMPGDRWRKTCHSSRNVNKPQPQPLNKQPPWARRERNRMNQTTCIG